MFGVCVEKLYQILMNIVSISYLTGARAFCKFSAVPMRLLYVLLVEKVGVLYVRVNACVVY